MKKKFNFKEFVAKLFCPDEEAIDAAIEAGYKACAEYLKKKEEEQNAVDENGNSVDVEIVNGNEKIYDFQKAEDAVIPKFTNVDEEKKPAAKKTSTKKTTKTTK